jgi:hypothetical protein
MNILSRPPVGYRRTNIRVINNRSDRPFGSPRALMEFYRTDGLEVRGNTAPLTTTGSRRGVHVEESCYVTVQDNSFANADTEFVIVEYDGCG